MLAQSLQNAAGCFELGSDDALVRHAQTWAAEGGAGFALLTLPRSGLRCCLGICMDINPYVGARRGPGCGLPLLPLSSMHDPCSIQSARDCPLARSYPNKPLPSAARWRAPLPGVPARPVWRLRAGHCCG